MNLLEPWILLRLLAGLLAAALFARAAVTAARVLRHFDVRSATEGQLALERHAELGAAFVRVAATVQVASLVLTVLAADRLSRGVRGAMCGYGVFNATPHGFPALFASIGVAVAAGVLLQLLALDGRVRSLELVRALSVGTLLLAPLSLVDLVWTARFLLDLDLTVVASCCSVQLDAEGAGEVLYASGPRVVATVVAVASGALAVVVALLAARRPTPAWATLAGSVAIAALPFAVAAAVLEVAPHAFEVPQHVCPFCLLKSDVWGLGYALFGALYLAAVWGLGAAAGGLFARGPAVRVAFASFARSRLHREAAAWLVALGLGAAPVLRYWWVSGGGSLFP